MLHHRVYPANGKELAADLAHRGIRSPEVLRAMEAVPREAFVSAEYASQAYADHPLPIASGQTISQPLMVAAMTELLRVRPGHKVLEIGTGSGYQAAVLAELGQVEVYTVEIIAELADTAIDRWPEHAPYDGIVVTAAAERTPPPLAEQLAEGGRLIIPLGAPHHLQTLWVFTRRGEKLDADDWGGVAFVPFKRAV